MQPLSVRMDNVKKFINRIKRGIEVQVVPIQDDFGPTKSDPNMDLIVGSVETAKGCDMGIIFGFVLLNSIIVNDLRREKELSVLDVYLVDCVGLVDNASVSEKISSSDIREFFALRAATNTK